MDQVVDTTGHVEIPSLPVALFKAWETNTPLPRETEAAIKTATCSQLFHWMDQFGARNVLRHPDAELGEHAARLSRNGHNMLELAHLFRKKMERNVAEPNPVQVLRALRQQCSFVLSELPFMAAAKLGHVYQVQSCPGLIRHRMLPLTACTFSVSGTSVELSEGLVPYKIPQIQWMTWSFPGDYVYSWLHRGRLQIDPDTFAVGVEYLRGVLDFSSLQGAGRRLTVSEETPVTFFNAMACHERAEETVLSGEPLPTGPVFPDIYVVSPSEDPFLFELDVVGYSTDAVWAYMVEKLGRFLENDLRPTDLTTRWFQVIRRPDIRSQLVAKSDSWQGYAEQFDEDAGVELCRAIWEDSQILKDDRKAIPLAFFTPASPQEPVRRAAEIYCKFRPEHFGRDVYSGGVLSFAPKAAAVQVITEE